MEWGDETSRRTFLKIMGASLALAGLGGAGGCTERAPSEKIIPYVRPPEQMIPGVPLFFASTMPWGGYGRGVLVESHEGRPTKVEGNPKHPATLGASDLWMQASVLQLYDPDRLQAVQRLGTISDWNTFYNALYQALGMARQGAEVQAKIGVGAQGQNDLSDQLGQTQRGNLAQHEGGTTTPLPQDIQASAGPATNLHGLSILTGTITSPTLGALLQRLVSLGAKWHQYEPISSDHTLAGGQVAFGRPVRAVHHYDQAVRILSIDEDFLIGRPASIREAHDFAGRRRWRQDHKLTGETFARLYMVESTRSITGAMADERLATRPSEIPEVALAVAQALGVEGVEGVAPAPLPAEAQRFVEAVAQDLKQHAGRCLVVAGESQPAHVHAVVHALNDRLKNVGATVTYIPSPETHPVEQVPSLQQLIADMRSGQCRSLLILGTNPVYDAPADCNFGEELLKFSQAKQADGAFAHFTAQLSLHADETGELCQWALPQSHWLESWGDLRAFDGTASIIQPLIEPLYPSKDALTLLSALVGEPAISAYELVRAGWRGQRQGGGFEDFWERSLEAGVVAGSAFKPLQVTLNSTAVASAVQSARTSTPASAPGKADAGPAEALQVIFRPDPTLWDGFWSNNAWLQELPKPLLKTTWDNVIALSPATAVALGLAHADEPHKANQRIVQVTYRGRVLEGAVWVWPGHADGCITLFLGYGHWRGGAIATGHETPVIVQSDPTARRNTRGYNAYALRTSLMPWWDTGLQLTPTDQRLAIACTQDYQMMQAPDRRDLVRRGTVDQANDDLDRIVPQKKKLSLSLYPDVPYDQRPNAWAMMIDNSTCIGCSACVAACQAENNIPAVGKAQVMAGRQMHWLRIDTYFDGDLAKAGVYFEPIPCMHCELAPCEPVCPVEATTHSYEGLNEMTYNRCIGTRYCSNNCPYKVRRFNFLLYSNQTVESLKMQRNPDVSVRSRGVMEKCTYCVQRINEARIVAERENRPIGPADIQTACQQACPTQAIVFGNQNDPHAQVTALKREPLKFDLLEELNTRPRTSYLPRLSNPNPAMQPPATETRYG
jgi:molybdopterin-containing oxidoreductase family iron-sulfur binding subunit